MTSMGKQYYKQPEMARGAIEKRRLKPAATKGQTRNRMMALIGSRTLQGAIF